MKIEYAVPCRGVELLANGTSVLIGVESNAFGLGQIPGVVRVMIFMCVSQPAVEAGASSVLRIRVLDPDLEPCANALEMPLAFGRHPNLPEGWATRMTLPALVEFQAPQPGSYSIEIALDKSSVSVALLVTGQ